MTRRVGVLICVFLILAIGLKTRTGAEEKFPSRPVELIVPYPVGGGGDIASRILSEPVEAYLGQKIVIVNKPGGSASIGTTALARAKPDGYTIGYVNTPILAMVPLVLKVSYTANDFSYISLVTDSPLMLCVRSEFPAKTAKEFFEYAGKNPGKLTYACDGIGGVTHVSAEKIFLPMKVKLRAIPYGGAGEGIKALLGGHVDVYSGPISPAFPHIRAGTVRGILITWNKRVEAIPEVVGPSDLGHPEAATSNWRGFAGPKGIPADRLAILEKAFQHAAQNQKVVDRFKELGEVMVGSSGKQLQEIVHSEAAAVAIVAEQLGLIAK